METNGEHHLSDRANRLLGTARERLREFGIALAVEPLGLQAFDSGFDAVVTLSRDGQRERYVVEVKERMTLSSVIRGNGAPGSRPRPPFPLLVIGDRISQRSAAAFRDAGIQFVDALGNASITFGSVLVEVQGRAESVAHRSSIPHDPVSRQPAKHIQFPPRSGHPRAAHVAGTFDREDPGHRRSLWSLCRSGARNRWPAPADRVHRARLQEAGPRR